MQRLGTVALDATVPGDFEALGDALQAGFERSRQQLTQLVTGSILLAAVMALGFGVWLARPFQRLEKAIVGLGENRLDLPIDIPGPPDVRRVSQQLEWLRLRLTELDADKARFLRHVSHELKTPLASLHEGVAVLGDGVAGALSPSQAEVVNILQHNTQLLQSQIEALLRFNAAAFEARQLKRERTDLRALLDLARQQLVEPAGPFPAQHLQPKARVDAAQRVEERLRIAMPCKRLAIAEMGVGVHDADLAAEVTRALGALEVFLDAAVIGHRTVEKTRAVRP